jgi:hypothetical protein
MEPGHVREINISGRSQLCDARFHYQSAVGNSWAEQARKHHHIISQCRPWNANAAMTLPSSDPWWDR